MKYNINLKLIMASAMFAFIAIGNTAFSQTKITDAREEVRKNQVIKMNKEKIEGYNLKTERIDSKENLWQLLEKRQSYREFHPDDTLSKKEMATLLWSANGLNREGRGRTSPSALAMNLIDIYLFDASGVYKWIPEESFLQEISKNDERDKTGMQEFVASAAANIVMVYDIEKAKVKKTDMKIDPDKFAIYGGIEAGAISQNIYLACAAMDLGTVVRGSFDNEKLLKILNLDSKTCRVICAQSVGRLHK